LGRAQRVTRSPQFDEAYAQGRKFVGRYMVLWLRGGAGAALRLGVVTGRKVGGAVQRVRARRLLREAYRKNRAALAGSFDVVIVGRSAILRASGEEIAKELLALAQRAEICVKS
jgi:ribonuclease P protein component